MASHRCPQCEAQEPRWLEASSTHARVDYYRCDQCGHVWNVPKGAPDAPPKTVTVSAKGETPPARDASPYRLRF